MKKGKAPRRSTAGNLSHRHRARPASTTPSPAPWPRPASPSWLMGDEADIIQHITVPGALEVPVHCRPWPTATIRRADRARLHHPRRDLPLRAGGQRKRRGRHASPGPPAPSPTPSSPSKTRRRPGPAPNHKGRDAARVAVEMANLLEDIEMNARNHPARRNAPPANRRRPLAANWRSRACISGCHR